MARRPVAPCFPLRNPPASASADCFRRPNFWVRTIWPRHGLHGRLAAMPAGRRVRGAERLHCDGHDFAVQAVERGARGVLAERPLATCRFRNASSPIRTLPSAASARPWSATPAGRLRVIGVTGTNGKTTTSSLIASILSAGRLPRGHARHAGLLRFGRDGARRPSRLLRPPELATLAGPDGRQRLLARRDGSVEPLAGPIARGRHRVRRRLRDERAARPLGLSRHAGRVSPGQSSDCSSICRRMAWSCSMSTIPIGRRLLQRRCTARS